MAPRILSALEARDAEGAMHIATDHIRDAKMDLLMMEDIPTGAARRAGTSPQGLDTLHG